MKGNKEQQKHVYFPGATAGVARMALERQGKTEDLKAHLWTTFEQTLSAPCLRKHLKLLPDFDDIEAEEAALHFAEASPNRGAAISFLVDWPSHDRAARTVLARAEELDGESWHSRRFHCLPIDGVAAEFGQHAGRHLR